MKKQGSKSKTEETKTHKEQNQMTGIRPNVK